LRVALLRSGYGSGLWWDNFGRFLVAQDLSDQRSWEGLATYVPAPGSAYYWDVAVFPEADADIARTLMQDELAKR
jgi:hypothetical protein